MSAHTPPPGLGDRAHSRAPVHGQPKGCRTHAALPRDGFYLSSLAPTPLVPVRLGPDEPRIWCKMEFLNPSGSTKDRIAQYILTKAYRSGRLSAGDLVVEASSGSTSIAMAMACAQLGLRFVAVMPEGVSSERSLMIRAYGGTVVFSPKDAGIVGALEHARRHAEEHSGFLPLQFANAENIDAHRYCTTREILSQIPGCTVDAVVAGVGTGGSLMGLYRGMRDQGVEAQPFAARPVTRSGAVSVECFAGVEQCSFSSRIPGVIDKISTLYDPAELEGLEELEVEDTLAIDVARQLIRMGFPVGPSSGLNYAAAAEAARRLGDEAVVVTVFCDRMERYFSTELFDESWLGG